MRKILLLLCIINITISANAQFTIGKKWKEGLYYDLNGVKHSGFISWKAPQTSFLKAKGDHIYYKPEKKADKIEIISDKLQSFVFGKDSFIVSKNKLFEKKPFLKVILNNTTTKLYSSLVTNSSSPSMTMTPSGNMAMSGAGFQYTGTEYYFGSDPDNVTELDKKNFIEAMSNIMADKPETVERIKNKKLGYNNMSDLFYFYEYGIMPPAQAPDPFSGSNN
jgi:hypothetical protein